MAQEKKMVITYVKDIPLNTPDREDSSWIAPLNDSRSFSRTTQKMKRTLSPRVFLVAGLMLLALATGAGIYALSMAGADAASTSDDAGQKGSNVTQMNDAGRSESALSGADSGAVSEENQSSAADSESAGSSEAPESSDPNRIEEEYAYLLPPSDYDYSAPVPASDKQDDNWFDDAVFVGNSRTQGLLLYTGISAKSYADVGLTVETVFTSEVFTDPDDPENKVTAAEALQKGDYTKVYLMFGINELGWQSQDAFLNKYASLIDTIQESHPDVQIYVQSILPVCESKITGKSYLTNARISSFNTRLQEMAKEQEVFYLDVASAVADESGALPADASTDGIHMQKDGCLIWEEYLLTHCVTSGKVPATGMTSVPGGTGDGKYAPIQLPQPKA